MRRQSRRRRQSSAAPAVMFLIGFAVVLIYSMGVAGIGPDLITSFRYVAEGSGEGHTAEWVGIPGLESVGRPDAHELEQGAAQKTYPYVLWGDTGSVDIDLYAGVNDYLSSNRPGYYGEDQEYYLAYINDNVQREYLLGLVDCIKAETTNADARARIAISLVQHIPYDYAGMFDISGNMRYPYQALYDGEGVCSEKTLLAAFLLREMGYGVALLEFPSESHMALGVKAPAQYTYKDTGYAFVEMTVPSIITDSDGEYMGVGKLTSNPRVYPVSDGKALGTLVADEYRDAQEYHAILAKGFVLDLPDYQRWQILTGKYGIY